MESRKASCSSVFGQGFPHRWLGAHAAILPTPPPPPPPPPPPSPKTTTTYLAVVYPSIVAHSNHFNHTGRSYAVRGKWKEGGGRGGGGRGELRHNGRPMCYGCNRVLQDGAPILQIKGKGYVMSHTLIHIVAFKVLSWLCIHAVATKEHRAAIVNRVCKVDAGIHNDTSVLADDGEGVWACQVHCRTGLKQNVSHERQLCNRVVPCSVRTPVRIVAERKVVVGPLGICSPHGWSVDCESVSSGDHQSSLYERDQYVSVSTCETMVLHILCMFWQPMNSRCSLDARLLKDTIEAVNLKRLPIMIIISATITPRQRGPFRVWFLGWKEFYTRWRT